MHVKRMRAPWLSLKPGCPVPAAGSCSWLSCLTHAWLLCARRRQLLLALAEWLCASYQSDPLAARVVRDVHLNLLPSMNPDGFAARTRTNA